MSDINANDPWAVTKAKFEHFSQHRHETQEHFPTFYHFGSKCSRIVEFGVFLAFSSWAWVACKPSFLRCVDVERRPGGEWEAIEETAPKLGIDFAFEIADSGHGALKRIVEERYVSISHELLIKEPYQLPTDTELLYIDSYHSYTHLKAELTIHGAKVKKYILFHDTLSFGEHHGFDGDKGLNYAIDEFLESNPNWKKILKVNYGHGCTVLANRHHVDDLVIEDPDYRFSTLDFA